MLANYLDLIFVQERSIPIKYIHKYCVTNMKIHIYLKVMNLAS